MRRTATLLAAAAAAGAVLLSGCSNLKEDVVNDPTAAQPSLTELQQRPRYEAQAQRYLAMLDEMRTALSRVEPALDWQKKTSAETGRSLCGDPIPLPGEFDADAGTFDSGDAKGAVPEGKWDEARAAVTSIGARYGFTQASAVVDDTPGAASTPRQDGERFIALHGPFGSRVEYGQQVNTTLVVYGPCLLHGVARGAETPTP